MKTDISSETTNRRVYRPPQLVRVTTTSSIAGLAMACCKKLLDLPPISSG